MAEITHVNPDHLYRLAARMDDTADRLAAMSWPALAPTALPGAAVSAAATSQPIAHRVEDVVTGLGDWAAAARAAADALAGADRINGTRFGGP